MRARESPGWDLASTAAARKPAPHVLEYGGNSAGYKEVLYVIALPIWFCFTFVSGSFVGSASAWLLLHTAFPCYADALRASFGRTLSSKLFPAQGLGQVLL